MSSYTTEVRFICESEYNNESAGFNEINKILTTVAPKIFNFDFPIFDEAYRLPLEVKILRTYYTREICEETVGLWKLRLQTKLCNIMPYYNQLYKSALMEFDVFTDINYTEVTDGLSLNNLKKIIDFQNLGGIDTNTYTKNGKEKSTTNYNGGSSNTTSYEGKETNSTDYNGTEKDVSTTTGSTDKTPPTKITTKSDTPQGGLNGLISEDYLTSAQKETYTTNEVETYNNITNDTEKSFTGRNDTRTTQFENRKDVNTQQFSNRNDINTLEFDNRYDSVTQEKLSKNKTDENNEGWNKNDNTLTVKGKRNNLTYAEMLQKYRETFINIDKMIIDELSDLFFNLW